MPAPVVQARVSLVNLCAVSLASVSASSAQVGWPASNLSYPQQPFVPWKTTSTAATSVMFDFGVARQIEMLMAVDVNYGSARIFLDSDPGFSPAEFDSNNMPIGRNPWNTRYTLVYLFSPAQTKRYLSFNIPSQSTTDGLSYFRTGGLWVGPLTAIPRDIRWDERPQRMEPHADAALLGGGHQRVLLGRPYVEMRAQRVATTLRTSPGTGDELGSWLEVDRLMTSTSVLTGTQGIFAWYFNRGNTAEGFVFRKMNASAWNVHQTVSEDELVLHEVVGP